MGFFKNLFGQGYSTKPDPHVLAGYTLPYIDPITGFEDACEQLKEAGTTEEAIAILLAYIGPKVEEKDKHGDPMTALNCLERDVGHRRTEITLVRRYFGLIRGQKTDWGATQVQTAVF